MLSWELGLKAVAIYRDNCKVGQPLSTAKKRRRSPSTPTSARRTADRRADRREGRAVVHRPVRQKLPRSRRGRTFEFRVADCKGFATIGEYDDGRPGEIFLTVSKQGSTLAGIMDAFAKSISYGLQYGVPLRAFVEAFTNMRFEPAGMTDDPDIRFASRSWTTCSAAWRSSTCAYDERAELGIFSVDERLQPTLPGVEESVIETSYGHRDGRRPEVDPVGRRARRAARARRRPAGAEQRPDQPGGLARPVVPEPAHRTVRHRDAPMCMQCGVQMVPRRLVPRLPELRQHQRLQLTAPRRA